MQIRILPHTAMASVESTPRLVMASYSGEAPAASASPATVPATSIYGPLGVKTVGDSTSAGASQALTSAGVIGYSVGGGGAQALVPVAEVVQGTPAVVKKLIYKPLYWQDIGSKDPEVGVCIYLGGMRHNPKQYPDYNWEQTYVSSQDQCGANQTYQDPCPKDKGFEHSQLYRPDPAKARSFQNAWGWNDLFRDMPKRPRSGGDVSWSAAPEYVGVPSHGDPVTLVEGITYGFSLHGSTLKIDPLVINGEQVDPGRTSTLDQAGPGGLTRVAPQKNGTDACIPYQKYKYVPAPPPPGIPMMPSTGDAQLRLPYSGPLESGMQTAFLPADLK